MIVDMSSIQIHPVGSQDRLRFKVIANHCG
jgi:hypothetical protein